MTRDRVTHNHAYPDSKTPSKIHQIEKKSSPKTAVNNQENGYNNSQNSGTVSKHIDPKTETKSRWNSWTHVWTALEDRIVVLFEGHKISIHPVFAKLRLNILPLRFFHFLHNSLVGCSNVHHLTKQFCSVQVKPLVPERIITTVVSTLTFALPPSRVKRQHSALNKRWTTWKATVYLSWGAYLYTAASRWDVYAWTTAFTWAFEQNIKQKLEAKL